MTFQVISDLVYDRRNINALKFPKLISNLSLILLNVQV